MDLRTLLRLKAAGGGGGEIVELTATGDIATFSTNLARKLKTVEVGITPVQDLHGQSNPYPPGGGLNKFPPLTAETKKGVTLEVDSDGTVTLNTVTGGPNTDVYFDVSTSFVIPANTTVRFYAFNPSAGVNKLTLFAIGTVGNPQADMQNANASSSKSYESDNEISKFRLRVPTGAELTNFKLKPYFQVGGTAPTAFAPYSNICPISGWTGAEVNRTGKNLADMVYDGYVPSVSTGQLVPFNGTHSQFIKAVPSTTYAYSFGNNSFNGIFEYDGNKNFLKTTNASVVTGNITTSAQTRYIMVRCDISGSGHDVPNCQLEFGSSVSPYEPYSIVTKTYPFPTPPGTVYGGSLMVNSDGTGVLTVDSARVLVSSLSWTYDSNNTRFSSTITDVKQYSSNRVTPYKGECFITVDDGRAIGNVPNFGIYGVANSKSVFVKDTDDSDPAVFTQKYGTTAIVYPLATPVSYNLSNLEVIQALSGTINNVWTNTGGQSTVTYYKKLNS